jgi:hypothetical protein
MNFVNSVRLRLRSDDSAFPSEEIRIRDGIWEKRDTHCSFVNVSAPRASTLSCNAHLVATRRGTTFTPPAHT